MSLILKQIFNLIRLLHTEGSVRGIAAGVALGFVLGLSPALSLQSILAIIVLLIFRIQITAALISSFFFKFIAFLLSPAFDSIGRAILEFEPLKPIFTTLYNLPIIPYTQFYNSVVMGAGALSIVLSPVVYMLARFVISKYQKTIAAKFNNSKLIKGLKATKLIQWYLKYEELKV